MLPPDRYRVRRVTKSPLEANVTIESIDTQYKLSIKTILTEL